VLLLAPNLVGHVRLLCTAAAVLAGARGAHPLSLALFGAAFALDFVDGWLARLLGQSSAFGAVYDVALDLAARGILWTWTARSPAAVLPVVLECLTFASTHAEAAGAGGAAHWKDAPAAPGWVRRVLGGGLRNPLGAAAVAGLFGCPLWLHARRVLPAGHALAAPWWGLLVVPGRLLAAAVEVHLLGAHVFRLMRRDAAALGRKRR
jgi:CDP-diacylglycerol--inositol 3-phosphatidyltransferase